jgi:hypothetical protein
MRQEMRAAGLLAQRVKRADPDCRHECGTGEAWTRAQQHEVERSQGES